jgi:hypothetical protein
MIVFSNQTRAMDVALKMNNAAKMLQNNETRGTTYFRWVFSEDAVVIAFAHGEGKVSGRFSVYYLVRGAAYKVGRDPKDMKFYGETVKVC